MSSVIRSSSRGAISCTDFGANFALDDPALVHVLRVVLGDHVALARVAERAVRGTGGELLVAPLDVEQLGVTDHGPEPVLLVAPERAVGPGVGEELVHAVEVGPEVGRQQIRGGHARLNLPAGDGHRLRAAPAAPEQPDRDADAPHHRARAASPNRSCGRGWRCPRPGPRRRHRPMQGTIRPSTARRATRSRATAHRSSASR